MTLLTPPGEVVAANATAAVLVWGWAVLAGIPIAALVRIPLGFAAVPLYGLAFWSASLYVLPFRGGQEAAIAVTAVAGAAVLASRRRAVAAAVRRMPRSPTAWLLGLLFLSLHTLPLLNHVPIGMDSTMHASSARVIADNHGLPRTYAPYAPTLPFPAVNLGVPALAAAAVRCGATPEAATLATAPFAYFGFVLALFLLLRTRVPRFGAAVLAAAGLMASRGLQETVCWGGYPTVAGFAIGLLAVRVLYDLARRPSVAGGALAGLLVAALPLVHGIGAAVWLYVCAPPVLIVGIAKVHRWRPVLRGAAAGAAVAALVLGGYLAFGATGADDAAREWTRAYQIQFAPKGEGAKLIKNAGADIVRWSGDEPAIGWLFGVGWLLVRGRWRAAGLLLFAAALILAVVVNAVFWVLPGSMALYPERAPYMLNALSALALALAWRALPLWSRRLRRGWAAIALLLVAACVPKYLDRYQRTATLAAVPPESRRPMSFPVVDREEYEALVWCRDHLDPAHDAVQARYNTAGSYLPGVAGIATTGWHVHCFVLPYQRAVFDARPPNYRFVVLSAEGEPGSAGKREVFRNARVVILHLPPP